MFSIIESMTSKASDLTESMRTSISNLDTESMKNLVIETNDRVSKIFSMEEEDENWFGRHVGAPAPPPEPANSDCGDDLPSFDEHLPGYAKPTAYLDESEQCARLNCTSRKITEADLDESDPLYCDREQRERESRDRDEDDQDSALVQCFLSHIQKLKVLLMESLMIS